MPRAKPAQVRKTLMQEPGLRQSDLREIGSQGVVSEVADRHNLNTRQIAKFVLLDRLKATFVLTTRLLIDSSLPSSCANNSRDTRLNASMFSGMSAICGSFKRSNYNSAP